MRSSKNTRRIEVEATVYRWRLTNQQDRFSLSVWPENGVGAPIRGLLGHNRESNYLGDKILITNRIIKRIIEYAITELKYNPLIKAKEYDLKQLDAKVKWQDAGYCPY
jgi:hypothetical protein